MKERGLQLDPFTIMAAIVIITLLIAGFVIVKMILKEVWIWIINKRLK